MKRRSTSSAESVRPQRPAPATSKAAGAQGLRTRCLPRFTRPAGKQGAPTCHSPPCGFFGGRAGPDPPRLRRRAQARRRKRTAAGSTGTPGPGRTPGSCPRHPSPHHPRACGRGRRARLRRGPPRRGDTNRAVPSPCAFSRRRPGRCCVRPD